jgi:hypothetical protein
MFSRALVQSTCLACVLSALGCKSPAGNAVSAAASASATASVAPAPVPSPTSFKVPIGPRLAILAGTGIGPIRFGATVATIERLMEAPCELRTPDKCRYIVQAVEFELKDGVVQRIVIHRHERPAGPDAQGTPQTYGFFNGGIPPYLGFGMIPSAFTKELGQPTSVEKVTTPNDFNTVERDTYPGMVLEYDRYTNGSIILGGVVLTKADTNPTPAIHTSAPSTPALPAAPSKIRPPKKK